MGSLTHVYHVSGKSLKEGFAKCNLTPRHRIARLPVSRTSECGKIKRQTSLKGAMMVWTMRILVALAVGLTCVLTVRSEDSPDKPKVKVEFRWVEARLIQGVTEEKGIRLSCAETLSYQHKKPILTGADVTEARLTKYDFSANGIPGEQFTVAFLLTKEARQKLAADCEEVQARMLTVVIDGRNWGAWNVSKSNAAAFVPCAGFIPSRETAERIIMAFK